MMELSDYGLRVKPLVFDSCGMADSLIGTICVSGEEYYWYWTANGWSLTDESYTTQEEAEAGAQKYVREKVAEQIVPATDTLPEVSNG